MPNFITESDQRSSVELTQGHQMRTLRDLVATAAAVAVGLVAVTGAPAEAAPSAVTHTVVVNPNPTDTTPHVIDGRTEAVLEVGGRVLIGGEFTQVKRWSKPEVFGRTAASTIGVVSK